MFEIKYLTQMKNVYKRYPLLKTTMIFPFNSEFQKSYESAFFDEYADNATTCSNTC